MLIIIVIIIIIIVIIIIIIIIIILKVDLALGHLAALEHVAHIDGCVAYNLGTGKGVSVIEMVKVGLVRVILSVVF